MKTLNIINILHLEDSESDSELVKAFLQKAGIRFEYYYADNEEDFQWYLKNKSIDIILSDYFLPDYSGTEALKWASIHYPFIPFVFVSGVIGEEAAIESLISGATDYVLKNRMERLGLAVRRAYAEAKEKKARQKAELEILKLSRAVEQSSNSIIITDISGIIEYANPATEKLTGFVNDEIIGQNPRIFSSGEKYKKEYEILWDTISSGKEWKGEFHNRKKSGELYWELNTISPIFNEKSEITHYLAIKEDVTERKKMTAELIRAKERAEESDRLKTAFLNNISHEIRSPMNSIVGFSRFLLEQKHKPEKIQYYADIIVKSSNQLLSVITDIMNIAAIEAGQEKIKEKKFKLNDLLRLIYEQYQAKIENRDIKLEMSLALNDTNDLIQSDKTKLRQIVSNLLGNAVKFTSKGDIYFGYVIKNDEIEFYVQDTGIGIPSEMHDEIFKHFRQVESGITRQYGGSGLGLSIAKAYTELLGGKIWLKSKIDEGSKFYFTIPYKPVDKSDLLK